MNFFKRTKQVPVKEEMETTYYQTVNEKILDAVERLAKLKDIFPAESENARAIDSKISSLISYVADYKSFTIPKSISTDLNVMQYAQKNR